MGNDLYREICRCPEDDTLRLAYADWLDENGDPDRAEFVRVQYELEGMPEYRGIRVGLDWSDPEFSPKCKRAVGLSRREEKILFAGPNWADCPCDKCEGTGVIDQGCHCPTCHGTGDLFLSRDERAPGHVHHVPRTVTFARGFPDAASCTLAEAFASDGVPTPWACEVVRRTPVTRFVLTDRKPERSAAFDGWFRWYTGPEQNDISNELYYELEGHHPEDRSGPSKQPYWKTAEAAVDALALAAGRLVRRHVYGGAAA